MHVCMHVCMHLVSSGGRFTVDEALRLSCGVGNLHFLAGSANACGAAAVDAVLEGEGGVLDSVSVQFPDPWPKMRHRKRRVVQLPLVADLAERLRPGGFVFLQSDVEEVAQDMRATFLKSPALEETSAADEITPWLDEQHRPFPGVKTERERNAERRDLTVFRTLLTRC